MRSWSIPLARVLGVNLRLHMAFLLLLLFIWMSEWEHYGPATASRGLALTIIILFSVLVHELAHLLVANKMGVRARAVILLPIGGISIAERLPASERYEVHHETRIALAGPAANLLLALIAIAGSYLFAPNTPLWNRPFILLGNLPSSFVWVNLALAAVNLLPAYPLDGGRILRAIFAREQDFVTATRRAVNWGNLFVLLLLFGGLWNRWFMLTGLFLFIAAQFEERTVLFHSVLESVRMDEIMLTDFSTLSPADTLEDALSKAVHSLQDDFPVVRGTEMVGVVTRQKILHALRAGGNAYVQSVMNRAFEISGRQDSLASAFRKLTTRGLTIIPVVEQERLVGIVTLQNLMHSMGVLAESRRLRRQTEDAI
jgi:Zn-dependent protease/CBS domain-containing protein